MGPGGKRKREVALARTGRRRRWAVAVGMVALVACAAAPVQAGPDRDFSGAVRASDPLSLALLRTAVASSPTVAALVDALEPTDVIVVVQVALTPNGLAGDLRLINAAGGARYLLIRVNSWQSPEEQMALLGHELQHANEVLAGTGRTAASR
jgi:hypothetical protein